MKNLILLLSFFLIFSCEKKEPQIIENKNKNNEINKIEESKTILNKNQATIESFKEFRNAIYKNDIKKVKEFFDFPLKQDYNLLWNLVNPEDWQKIDNKNLKPFTEKDFDKYYKVLFDNYFFKTLQSINTESFNKVVNSKILKHNNIEYQSSVFLENENFLKIGFSSEQSNFNKVDGEKEYSNKQFSYVFKILNNGKLKFYKIEIGN